MRNFIALILLVGIGVGCYMYKSEDGSKRIKAEIDISDYKLPYMPRLPLDLAFDEDRVDEAADL